MSKKQILIIDDETDFARLLKMNVERTGEYEAVLAGTGLEGVECVKARQPDLVLLDITMPGMDGFETLKRIKTLAPDLPVAMVTACWNEDEAKRIIQAGAYEYITKPVDFEYLKTALFIKLFS
jgi:CheY-like chemotaxis protein